ncbi:MAG: ABC transporter ATP-binding protein, partial [Candidatus Dadabacteria bacterium]
YITHDPDLAARGRRRVVLHDGRIIPDEGSPAQR